MDLDLVVSSFVVGVDRLAESVAELRGFTFGRLCNDSQIDKKNIRIRIKSKCTICGVFPRSNSVY